MVEIRQESIDDARRVMREDEERYEMEKALETKEENYVKCAGKIRRRIANPEPSDGPINKVEILQILKEYFE